MPTFGDRARSSPRILLADCDQMFCAVARPDDLFTLSPDQWHVSKRLLEAPAPCTREQCEAGFTSGGIVVSAERSGEFIRIIAGFRGCEAVGSSEVEVGTRPGKATFGRVREQIKRVVKGVSIFRQLL